MENKPSAETSARSEAYASSSSPKISFSQEELKEIQRLEIILESGENFLTKQLTKAQQHALFDGIRKHMIKSSYDLANEILGENSSTEEKKMTTEIAEAKISLLEKKLELL